MTVTSRNINSLDGAPSTACTCRFIVRATSTSVKASISTYRRSRAGWVSPRQCLRLRPVLGRRSQKMFCWFTPAVRTSAECHARDD